MPIQVTCPGCKATFNVSEKYAGRQGPCPKCKAVITIPKVEAAKPAVEVKIAEPEEAQSGPKSAAGRPVLKPIERRDARWSPVKAAVIAAIVVGLFVAAWFAGPLVTVAPLSPEQKADPSIAAQYAAKWWTAHALRAAALIVVGLPIIWAGYLILRDDELEPFAGRGLLIRSLICLAIYMALWGLYGLIPADVTASGYAWLYLAPPFFVAGFVAAYFCFELDPTSAAFHYVFFVLVTLLLGMTAGLTMPWSDGRPEYPVVPPGVEIPVFDEFGRPIGGEPPAEDKKPNGRRAPARSNGGGPTT